MYVCKEYTEPIWKGGLVRYESFFPVADRNVRLLYRADEIIEVCSMTQQVVYEAGKDYILRDGGLYIPEGSAIKVLSWEDYNPQEKSVEKHTDIGFTCKDGGYLMFSEGAFFHNMEYCVTYRHSDAWEGIVPTADPAKLPQIKARIAAGKPFVFGFLGDSIPAGGNSSRLIGAEPFAPIWPEMICERLTEVVGAEVRCVNKSVGGMNSAWGVEVAHDAFKDDVPDLLLIHFGMNDASGKMDRFEYRDNIRKIADTVRALNPKCEVLLVSTTLPNRLADQFYRDHLTHENLLGKLCGEYGADADLVPMTTMHRQLMEKKHFWDMTGNNINHPNDFLVRVYAQSVLAVLGAE